jgi:two-component system chemotaxis response regulator CheY
MSQRKVLSLGQCGSDHDSISRVLWSQFGVEVTAAATFEDALARLRQDQFALVLVNRVLDYDGRPGLDFIARLKEDEQLRAVPVMLVSNYADAQQEAVARGALPGFGKSELRQPQTLDRLRAALSLADSRSRDQG